MKRLVLILCAAAVTAAVGVYVVRTRLASAVVQRVIAEAQTRAAARGVTFSEMEPGRATLTGPFSLECEGFRGRMFLPRGVTSAGTESYLFVVRRVRVRVDSVFAGRIVVSFGGGSVYKLGVDGNATGEWISDVSGEGALAVSLTDWRESVKAMEARLARFLNTGAVDIPARIRGRARFLIRKRWFEAAILSQTDGNETRLVLDRTDVENVSKAYAQQLTDTEIDLVAGYPTLAPVLLQLTDQAKQAAVRHARADPSFPQDAFRHVYWSYLLTRRFGPQFAELVTDAHEIEATYEKGEANRLMDLQNNAVGRDYAIAGITEAEVAQRVRSDVRVVKRAR